jgi:hypothetical protein
MAARKTIRNFKPNKLAPCDLSKKEKEKQKAPCKGHGLSALESHNATKLNAGFTLLFFKT